MKQLKYGFFLISIYLICAKLELISCEFNDAETNNELNESNSIHENNYMIKRFKRDDETNSTKLSTVSVTESTTTIPTSSIITTNSARVPTDATTVPTTKKPKPTIISEPITINATDVDKTSQSMGMNDEISIDTIDKIDIDIENNRTLMEQVKEDYFIYYNSTVIVDEAATKKYWSDLGNLNISNLLSKSHRRAMTVHLSFDFPFYGHIVRNITIATGGFLYTGDYVHSWLAATQYIAPLMANFDTSISNAALVKFVDNGTAFSVVWEKVSLQDRPNIEPFTFSTTLLKSGDIIFAYRSVPILIESIQDDKHPVKVGLSDAYIIDKTVFFARRKTIYEYHRVNFGSQDIKNWTLIILTAQPTCLSATDCETCLTKFEKVKCTWCPTLNRCSTGMDRKRQDWLQKGCDKTQIVEPQYCPADRGNAIPTNSINGTFVNSVEKSTNTSTSAYHEMNHFSSNAMKSASNENVGVLVGILLPIIVLFSCVSWVFYAYRNPLTRSGQLLIQYRPTTWSLRRGEARYTAATIHM